jgi:hypothetical protein
MILDMYNFLQVMWKHFSDVEENFVEADSSFEQEGDNSDAIDHYWILSA